MKSKLLWAALLCNVFFALGQSATEIRNEIWNSSDPYKKATTAPEKWKNESAVIIYKHENYDYHKFGINVTYTSSIRKRILLLDQAAVKEFSEFSYRDKFYSNKALGSFWRRGTNFIGVKIVKPDGKEVLIDTDKEAKEVDGEKKLAIPNLEIGDIIDYYFYSVEPFKSVYDYTFEAVETPLGDVYPTMNLKITLHTENDFFLNFNTYNGAPPLNQIDTGKSSDRLFELKAENIDKNEFPRWFYPLAEMPCYKFQVIFARSGKFEKLADGFLPESEKVVKKTISKEDIFEYYNKKFYPDGDLGVVNRFLKEKSFSTEEEKVREIYYFCRHEFFTRYFEAFVVNEAKIMYPFSYYGTNPIFFRDEVPFVNYFMQFLKKQEISYDVIIATPRFNGSIDDLLIQQNVRKLIRVNTPKPIYIEYFNAFSGTDQVNYSIENSKAYVLEISKGKRVTDVSNVTLPSSTYKDNVSRIKTKVDLVDFTGYKVQRDAAYLGHLKESEQDDKLQFYDFVYEDYNRYGTMKLMDYVRKEKDRKQYTNELDALIKKQKDKQTESYKSNVEGEYEVKVEDYTFEIKNTGRYGKDNALEIHDGFTIANNYVKKAGDKYLLEIGRFLTSQIEIDKKEIDRKNNIYMSFPRSFENEITFNIPDGYSVSGLEKLNKTVENETGGFVSSAEVKGNQLVIKTLKYYKNYYEPNANWNKMIQFLDAAYQFTQEKILLKKN
ncbi:MAG: hypothetical protein RLZZ500_2357 [Bacteroidota bacterium]|jgi:hypothetical protein